MKVKRLPFVLVMFMLVLMLAACGGGSSTGEVTGETKTKGGDDAKKVSDTPTELVFYVGINGWDDAQFMGTYGNQIKKKFPNYTLKFIPQKDANTLSGVLTAGQPIDIIISSIGLTSKFLTTYNLQYDISDLIKKYNYDLSRLEPSTIAIQKQLAKGGIYGLPVSTTSAALFYNKSLFDKFATPYPKDGMLWDDVYELAKRMTRDEGGVQYKGFTMSFQHLMLLNQLSAPFLDSTTYKAQLSAEPFRQAFENLARFYKITGNELTEKKYNLASQQEPFYKTQNVAMHAALSTSWSVFKDTVNWDMVQLPFFKDKPGVGPQTYPNYFYITESSKNKDAAFQVLAYVTSDEYQEYMGKEGNPSILKDQSKLSATFASNAPYLKGKNIKSLLPEKFAEATEKTKYQSIADNEVLVTVVDVANGKDVNTALRESADKVDKAIALDLGSK